jgi:uncharacterized protein (TIGR02246 family)
MKLYSTLFALVCLLALGTSSATAQTTSNLSIDESQVSTFTTSWESAFNSGDHNAIADMFTADGERTATDGTTVAGRERIAKHYADQFSKGGKFRVRIRTESTAPQTDGSVISTGQYISKGTDADGNEVVYRGTFRNQLVKENQRLRIKKMRLFEALN